MINWIKKLFSSKDGYSVKINNGDTLIIYADHGPGCGGCVIPLNTDEEKYYKDKFKSLNKDVNIIVLPTTVRLGEVIKK